MGGGGGGGGGERWGAELRYAARVVQSQEKIAEAGWRRGGSGQLWWGAMCGITRQRFHSHLTLAEPAFDKYRRRIQDPAVAQRGPGPTTQSKHSKQTPRQNLTRPSE